MKSGIVWAVNAPQDTFILLGEAGFDQSYITPVPAETSNFVGSTLIVTTPHVRSPVLKDVWSPVFVPLVFPITTSCASVTYRLFELSAMSAVVASAPAVTSPFESYVIFVLVAPVIQAFAVTFVSAYSFTSLFVGYFVVDVSSVVFSLFS